MQKILVEKKILPQERYVHLYFLQIHVFYIYLKKIKILKFSYQ